MRLRYRCCSITHTNATAGDLINTPAVTILINKATIFNTNIETSTVLRLDVAVGLLTHRQDVADSLGFYLVVKRV